jgi:hypothetical protein
MKTTTKKKRDPKNNFDPITSTLDGGTIWRDYDPGKPIVNAWERTAAGSAGTQREDGKARETIVWILRGKGWKADENQQY